MVISHFKKTNIAWAPDILIECIKKYTDHVAYLNKIIYGYDIQHFHNVTPRYWDYKKNQLIQYHSEPFRCSLDFPGKQLVVAQYQATLPEYADATPVRNIIDFADNYEYAYYEVVDKIRVGYSPSVKRSMNQYYDKGFALTKNILEKLKTKYPKDFDFDIITDAPLSECIERKSMCNVIIDECITGSYHRSGLEGLALGKHTICFVKKPIRDMLKSTFGLSLPFDNVDIQRLESRLVELIEIGVVPTVKKGWENKEWMFKNWHPKDVIQDYIKAYREVLDAKFKRMAKK